MTLRIAAILFCVAGTIAADEPKKLDGAEQLKSDWKVASLKRGGEAVPADFATGG
jgi:hypothetical protein